MGSGPSRKTLILVFLGVAALALVLLAPSIGRPQRESAYDRLQETAGGSASVSSTPVTRSEEPAAAQVGSAVPAFSAGDLLGLALRLLLVGGVIAATLLALKFYMQKMRTVSGGTGVVRVLDTLGLATGRAIYVVDAGEKVLLVGATQTQIAYLGEITAKDTIHALRTAADLGAAGGPGLLDALRGLASRFALPAEPRVEGQPAPQPARAVALRRLMESHLELRARLSELQDRHRPARREEL